MVAVKKEIVIRIDKDYLWQEGDEFPSRVGTTWEAMPGVDYDNTFQSWAICEGPKVRFRLLDDDGEVYYGGWLRNDPDCSNQLIVLRWAEQDAGATEIQVRVNDGWVAEIG